MSEVHVFIPVGDRLDRVRFDELAKDLNPARDPGMTLSSARQLIEAIKVVYPFVCSVVELDSVTGYVRRIELYWRYSQVPYSDHVLYFESDRAQPEKEDLTILFRREHG